MKNKWEPEGRIRWCWLTRGGASRMLQEFVKEGATPGSISKECSDKV